MPKPVCLLQCFDLLGYDKKWQNKQIYLNFFCALMYKVDFSIGLLARLHDMFYTAFVEF